MGNLVHHLKHLNYDFHGKTSPTIQEINMKELWNTTLFIRGDFLHES